MPSTQAYRDAIRSGSSLALEPRRCFVTRVLSTVLATLLFWLPASEMARAQDPQHEQSRQATEHTVREDLRGERIENDGIPAHLRGDVQLDDAVIEQRNNSAGEAPDTRTPISLPGGAEASAVTPQAISLPNAEGSVEGMGESFSPVLSSGTATFSVPIAVAPGRAGVQPSLGLSYSTTGGNGPVGFGWNLGAPFISRQTDRGLPRYVDAARWHGQEDRFMYNGGQELVPVDNETIARVDAQANGGVAPAVPSELAGWQQYRARVEGGFMRFFRAPDSNRWVVESKDGTRFEFGRLSSGPSEAVSASSRALERDPERTSGGIYRWCLTRMSDAHGSSVYYVYDQHAGHAYLSDIYYVSPHTCRSTNPDTARRCTDSLGTYGARVHLDYEARTDVFASYVAGWRIETARRLRRIEVTAHETSARTLVRRYHLTYAADSFHSLLEQVQVEGRPHAEDSTLGALVGDRSVPEGSSRAGVRLPPMVFRYTSMPSTGAIPGFGGIDARVRSVVNSPPHSVDEGRSDLFDVNSDGLPDLIVTDPARYRTADGRPAVGVFFNGFTGSDARPAGAAAHFSGAVPMPMRSDLSSVLSLSNLNVVPMDIDGDGRSDLLHMPRLRTYGWWAPTRGEDASVADVSPAGQGWQWTYASITLPAGDTDPRIDLGRDASHTRVLDVNNDHLIDVVRTTGTVMQTWINLGFLPGGDGRFGSYRWTGSEYELSTLPFESCLLYAGTPIDFEDPEVRLADLNGDGLQDIAKIRRGRVIYWPGRGEGVWGDGSRTCAGGEGAGRYIEMTTPPAELAIDLDGVFLEDVNMDGAADLVQVRFREVDVWFNRAGAGWTPRTTARGTPSTPSFAPRIRFADIDGSSTTDIIWGNAGAWEYIDPSGGRRPRLLVGVENGLGAQTSIEYGSSAEDYLSDLEAADACRLASCERFTWGAVRGAPDARLRALSGQSVYRSAGSPVISTVVRSVSTTDRFDVLGREAQVTESQFAYHDGYYEGIEQEFRGFGAADAVTTGDWNNPTVSSRTHFLQGRRPSSIADDRLADNPDEALKGREVMTEVFDEAGAVLSTSFAAITNRRLATGLDGRAIHYAFVHETNELRYDTTPFEADGTTFVADAVVRERVDASSGELGDADPDTSGTQLAFVSERRSVAIRGQRAARIRITFDEVDNLGHLRRQTAHGQVSVSGGDPIDGLIVSHTEPVLVGGWIWRTGRTFVTGHDATSSLGDTTNAYNAAGDLIRATQLVVSPQTYAFDGESGAEGGAALFIQDDAALIASTVHDPWGNALASCAGHDLAGAGTFAPECLRFGSVTYDAEYAQLAVSEHLRVRAGGAGSVLTYAGTWDRGLGAILSSTDPNALTTRVSYDGLGRLTSVVAPPVDGCTIATPSTRIRYELTTSPTTQPISRVVTTTELDCNGALGEEGGSLVSIAYVDGLGRARAALATGDEAHAWVRSGITTLDRKGSVRRTYQTDFFDGSDTAYSSVVALPRGIPYAVTRYDAFGRARGVHAEDGSVTWTSYHALSTDVCDPLDNDPSSEHYRTCTTARTDGHGRVNDQVLRNRHPGTGAAEMYRLWTYYRADGAVLALVRAASSGARPLSASSGLPAQHVARTFTYDSAGRRLSSDDPDTDDLTNTNEGSNSWRYLFNRVGDLVAVRDPRGCGQNFYYDFGGRLVGEQYVSCAEAQSARAERPHADNAVGGLIAMTHSSSAVSLDAVYHYDAYPAWALELGAPDAIPSAASGVLGRATGVSDRGQRAVLAYDARGNVSWTARQMALISDELRLTTIAPGPTRRPVTNEVGPGSGGTIEYDEAHTYTRTASFDHAGRPQSMALPRDPDDESAPLVTGTLTYNRRGLPSSASAGIGSETQTIVAAIEYLRDGLVSSITYGDGIGGRAPTTSTTTYDIRRRPVRFRTTRAPTGLESLAAVTVPVDQRLVWDAANNLVTQVDHRSPSEWPEGHRPQTVHVRHDALYRVVGADFDYTQTDGRRIPSDVGSDWRLDHLVTRAADPMRQRPAPMAPRPAEDRVANLTWTWDYLANTTEWTDDAQSFYERSLGAITNGDDAGPALRPSALYLASNIGGGSGLASGGGGWLEVDYGRGGNVTAMTVHAQCAPSSPSACVDPGGTDLEARRTALRRCACAREQHYEYRWDELNRLAEARRYDRNAPSNNWARAVRQRYRYDASNRRTVKQTLDEQEGTDPPRPGLVPRERTALYVYPGDFERRGLTRGTFEYQSNDALGTETQYIVAGARTVWRSGTADPAAYDRDHRLTVALTDLIQTTGAVLDIRTGELLEASTYYPNGARETFLAEASTATAPEPSGFTGKEADEEVGLVYFGERYLIPRLGRWASPDPLHVHTVGGGEALNSYHYVSGNMLAARDPYGLCSDASGVNCGRVVAALEGAQAANYSPDAVDRAAADITDAYNRALSGASSRLSSSSGIARVRAEIDVFSLHREYAVDMASLYGPAGEHWEQRAQQIGAEVQAQGSNYDSSRAREGLEATFRGISYTARALAYIMLPSPIDGRPGGPGRFARGPVSSRHFSVSAAGRRLAELTRRFRARHPDGANVRRNFATADVQINGQRRTVQFVNQPELRDASGNIVRPGIHSEDRLMAWHQRMTRPRSGGGRGADVRVLRVHTERVPCGAGSANCSDNLGNYFGQDLDVYHNQSSGPYRPIPSYDIPPDSDE